MAKTTINKPPKCLARHAFVIGLIFLLPTLLIAQDNDQAASNTDPNFRLFEDIENSNSSTNQSRSSRITRENRNTPSTPEFTLVGTSRIGNKYQAILLNRNGESIVVNTSPSSNTRVPGFADYSVVNISAGNVALRYPGNNPCVEHQEKGVTCNSAANIASLSLTNGEPIAIASNIANRTENIEAGSNDEDSPEENTVVNPFEALRASQAANAANSDAESNSGRFRPRRIDPEDVPPGSRVISTPFGDRIVEQ
ncbi:MAG: hypothetical protein GKR91_16665 [Pseudomonadales bacterium]|nr:hypothetical protein [Pseudomonadales bacterium]